MALIIRKYYIIFCCLIYVSNSYRNSFFKSYSSNSISQMFNKYNNNIQSPSTTKSLLQMAKKRNSNLEKELSSMSSTNKNNNNNSNNNNNNNKNKKIIEPSATNEIKSNSEEATASKSMAVKQQQQQEDDNDQEEEEGFKMIDTIKQEDDNDALVNSNFKPLRVPKNDPTAQIQVPPEIVFFGDPRRPPPVEAARDNKYHGPLLAWARHASVVPQSSEERIERVFPKGQFESTASKYRLNENDLTYQKIFDAFLLVKDNIEESKAFIASNIDLVPSKLFLRALTADKLSAQSKKNSARMFELKEIRDKYILAHHQLFFPLNIEVQKAETRVMTFLAREELKEFAQSWDTIEISLHFTTLLAARLTWDDKVRGVLNDIKSKVSETLEYMAGSIQKQLMAREFRKPGTTAEIYLNATFAIERNMPNVYKLVRPEIKALHETFFMKDNVERKMYITQVFCPKENISLEKLKESLRIFDASLAAIQGVNYIPLRILTEDLLKCLCTESEYQIINKWYIDFLKNGYGFDTYEPDEIPSLIKIEQRLRDTGNSFTDFAVQVMKRPTKYTEAFSGARPKGSTVGNWLEDDPDWKLPAASSQEERLDLFRQAYIEQSRLRREAETSFENMIENKLATQDKRLSGNNNS